MDELFFLALGLLAVLALVASPVLAIIALVRSGRVKRLERRIESLEQALREREWAGAAPAARRATPPAAQAQPAPAPGGTPASGDARPDEQPGAPAPTPRVAEGPRPAVAGAAVEPDEELLPGELPAPAPSPLAARYASASTEPLPEEHFEDLVGRPAPPERPRIEWERWIGVRGAAIAGGVLFALAGVLFFKHAFDQGWITPTMRVVTGLVAGVGAILVGEVLRPRGYKVAPAAVAAAGVVVLYASLWAANQLYGLISLPVAFGGMAAVTVACCALSVRHRTQLVAVLGLVGGFGTPLLLAVHGEQPLGLFGYVLFLDVGLIVLGRRMRWPLLGLVGVLGTFVLQGLWTATQLRFEVSLEGLAFLALSALVFVVLGKDQRGRLWQASRAGALVLPGLLALSWAYRVDLGPRLLPIAGLVVVLAAGAGWMARAQRMAWLEASVAAIAVSLTAVWSSRTSFDEARAWELVLCSIAMTLPFLAFRELALARGELPEPARRRLPSGEVGGAAVAALGLLAVCATGPWGEHRLSPWPWLAGFAGLHLVAHRVGRAPGAGLVRVVSALLAAGGLALWLMESDRSGNDLLPAPVVLAALLVAFALLLLALARGAWSEGAGPQRRCAAHAAAAFAAVLLFALAGSRSVADAPPAILLESALLLWCVLAVGAAWTRKGLWLLVGLAALFACHALWFPGFRGRVQTHDVGLAPLLLVFCSAALVAAWPALLAPRFERARTAFAAAALAPVVYMPLVMSIYEHRTLDDGKLPIPLAQALVAGACLALARLRVPAGARARTTALAWYAAAATCMATLAVPFHLDRHVGMVWTALWGLALVAVWRRIDHAGLKLLGVALLARSFTLVVEGTLESDRFESGDPALLSWATYAVLIPAAAMLAGSLLLRGAERHRARSWEEFVYVRGWPVLAGLCGLGAVLTFFVWINLSIYDLFDAGPYIRLRLDRFPQRDLTLSIAWAVYALALLALGMSRKLSSLRWLSLAFLFLSLGKVFLHDLGNLQGLYRVASLLGLGVSLLLVSVLYQRFVFPRRTGVAAA